MCVFVPAEVTEGVIVDIGHITKRQCLLGVVEKDGVFRCHSKHQPVGQLEHVGQRLQ